MAKRSPHRTEYEDNIRDFDAFWNDEMTDDDFPEPEAPTSLRSEPKPDKPELNILEPDLWSDMPGRKRAPRKRQGARANIYTPEPELLADMPSRHPEAERIFEEEPLPEPEPIMAPEPEPAPTPVFAPEPEKQPDMPSRNEQEPELLADMPSRRPEAGSELRLDMPERERRSKERPRPKVKPKQRPQPKRRPVPVPEPEPEPIAEPEEIFEEEPVPEPEPEVALEPAWRPAPEPEPELLAEPEPAPAPVPRQRKERRPEPSSGKRPAQRPDPASRKRRETEPEPAPKRRKAPEPAQRQSPQAKSKKKPAPKSKKVFSPGFKKGFFISWGIFVVLLIAALVLLWTRLGKYESNLPDHYIIDVRDQIAKGGLDSLHVEDADGKKLSESGLLIDEDYISSLIRDANTEKPLTYVKVNAESTDTKNVYVIRSGDKTLARVWLEKNPDGQGWHETKTILATDAFPVSTVTAQIPTTSTLLVGGKEVPRSYITEEGAEIKLLSNLIQNGIIDQQPTVDTYTVKGIFPETGVEMQNEDGKKVACTKTEDVYMAGFEADEAFAKEQEERVLSMFEPYALYFSGDAGRDALSKIMLDGSPAYDSAVSADVSWMQEHEDVKLSEQRAENFRKYSDECFSCDIHFLEDIYQNGESVRTWDTNMTWIFVKDGNYYIADFMTRN